MSVLWISLLSFFALPQDSAVQIDSSQSYKQRLICLEVPNTATYCRLPILETQANNWLLYQPEVSFWLQNIQLSEDSFLVVDQLSRSVVDVVHKRVVLDIESGGNLKGLGQLYQNSCFSDMDSRIKFVRGRRTFFNYAGMGSQLKRGMDIFENLGVEALYAQLLLLIESPNNSHAVSVAGARGHFQLMPSVARKYGLKINQTLDERVDFDKSAMVAAKLFKFYCVPSAKQICEMLGLAYEESDLWFQLLTLHVYNAGAGNVKKAAALHQGITDGSKLISQLWHTKAGAFGNSSQNYSQLCLASYLAYTKFMQINDVQYTGQLNREASR